jgi:N utilization substance protein A
VLEAFNLSPDDAEALIMRARVIMGWVEAPPEPEYEEEFVSEGLDNPEDYDAAAAEGEASNA